MVAISLEISLTNKERRVIMMYKINCDPTIQSDILPECMNCSILFPVPIKYSLCEECLLEIAEDFYNDYGEERLDLKD